MTTACTLECFISQLGRWALFCWFNFTISYRPGSNTRKVDALWCRESLTKDWSHTTWILHSSHYYMEGLTRIFVRQMFRGNKINVSLPLLWNCLLIIGTHSYSQIQMFHPWMQCFSILALEYHCPTHFTIFILVILSSSNWLRLGSLESWNLWQHGNSLFATWRDR